MKCLCCNKEILDSASPNELETRWHKKCVKTFFGTSSFPEIDISTKALTLLTNEITNKGYTVPGVQEKLSLHLSKDGGKARLTIVNYPMGYILKPQIEEYECLPEAEFLIMQMAKTTGIKTVPFALLKIDDQFAYITKRVDRVKSGKKIERFAMEDFCQLDGRLTEDKYKGSYERCAKIINKYSSREAFDLSELFLRIVFCFVVGNSDMHLKNFSLIETAEESGLYVLAPAYDLLPVNIILTGDKNQFGLALNGKLSNAHRKDFLKFATTVGLNEVVATKIIESVSKQEDKYLSMCDESFITDTQKQNLKTLISERVAILKG